MKLSLVRSMKENGRVSLLLARFVRICKLQSIALHFKPELEHSNFTVPSARPSTRNECK